MHGTDSGRRRVGRERRRGPAQRPGARDETGFEQNLGAVADAEHEFAGLRAFDHGVGQLVVRRDGARPHAIFVREAARQHERIECAQRRPPRLQ